MAPAPCCSRLDQIMCKVQPPTAAGGRFTKDDFQIDLDARRVTCPAGQIAPLRPSGDGQMAYFGAACAGCALAARCTTSKSGRTIAVGPHEHQLAAARERQALDQAGKATRPKVERKQAHMMRHRHGGRSARVRGQTKIAADFSLLGAAVNLARLAVLGLSGQHAQERLNGPTGPGRACSTSTTIYISATAGRPDHAYLDLLDLGPSPG